MEPVTTGPDDEPRTTRYPAGPDQQQPYDEEHKDTFLDMLLATSYIDSDDVLATYGRWVKPNEKAAM